MVKAWLVVGLFSITATAQAAVISYASLASFTAAAGPQTVITFDGLPLGTVTTCLPVQPYTPDPCVFAQGPVTFVSTKGETLGDVGLQRPLLSLSSAGILSNECPCVENDFYASFAGQTIGFDITAPSAALTRVILTEVGGGISTFDLTNAPTFFGATSALGFTRVSWVAARNVAGSISNFTVDNVRVESVVTPVPEPASLVLLGSGLVALARRRARRLT